MVSTDLGVSTTGADHSARFAPYGPLPERPPHGSGRPASAHAPKREASLWPFGPCWPPRGAASACPTRRPTRVIGRRRLSRLREARFMFRERSLRPIPVPRAAPRAAPLACHVPSTHGRCGPCPQRRPRRVPRVPNVASHRTSEEGRERHPRPRPSSCAPRSGVLLGPRPLTRAVRSGRPRCSGARACPRRRGPQPP